MTDTAIREFDTTAQPERLTPASPGGPADNRIKRLAPAIVAAVFAIAYVIIEPPSLDLAAHLARAKLFGAEGFGLWDNWWYAGHHVPGYSVLFPPIAWLLTPQVAGALAAVGTAALFEPFARRRFGDHAWLGATWFGAATATNLFTGRLTFAFGLLPAMGMVLALQRKRPVIASVLALITALASPVAALFSALAAAAYAISAFMESRRLRATLPGIAAVVASLLPVALLSIAFPEGGSEPFTLATLWPIPAVAAIALVAVPREDRALRIGIVLYALGCIAAYLLTTPVGSNAARLGPLVAGPLAAFFWWQRRKLWLAAAALPLLWFQWQAPIRDVRTSAGDPSVSAAYYQPLLTFLSRQAGPPFRVEIPFTRFHWEAYQVAPRFPLARGWERQLDIRYNQLFYDQPLNARTYQLWLHQLAVRFVAVPDATLDFSAHKEAALIDRGLPYLRLVDRTTHWRVYAVAKPTPIVTGAASLRSMGPNSITLNARHPGTAFIRVRFSPYWALSGGPGCVQKDGDFMQLQLRTTGEIKLVMKFALSRIGESSPRCT
jgi:hypothetical protein